MISSNYCLDEKRIRSVWGIRWLSWLLLVFLSIQAIACSESVLEVDGQTFSRQYIDAYFTLNRVENAGDDEKRMVLDVLVSEELLARQAQRLELDKDIMLRVSLDMEKRRKLARLYREYLAESMSVESEAREYFDVHQEKYRTQNRDIGLVVFYLRTKQGGAITNLEAATQRATNAYAALKSGTSFEEVARKYSDDPISKKKGGHLGLITQEQLDGEIAKLAFELPTGEFSKPVVGDHAIAIVKAFSDSNVQVRSFDTVKDSIIQKLHGDVVTKKIQQLRDLGYVTEDTDRLP